MRHVYTRIILAIVWLVVAVVSGISGNLPMVGFYIIMGGMFLYSAYAAWKKENDSKGGW